MISYFDRQTVPLAIKAIQRDIPISNTGFSDLQAAFLTAYALMYALGGRLIDALGTRLGFLLIMIWWSLACASHGLARGFRMLVVSRFLLGMGEGGGFPAATKTVAEWFPVGERSLALGVMNGGSAVGAVIAPPFIAAVLSFSDWRWVFFLSGAAGLFWCLWWSRAYWSPGVRPRLSAVEQAELASILPARQDDLVAGRKHSWFRLFSYTEVVGLIVAKFLSDAAWFFYLFWLPKYLYDIRGFDVKGVGYFGWIPYAASGIGCVAGGWFSGWLIRRGASLNLARKIALGLSAALMPSVLIVTHAPVQLAIVLFSIVFFGHQSWSTLVMVMPADLFPQNLVGSVAGLIGFAGALGGVVLNVVIGRLLDAGFGYSVVFGIVSVLHVTAFLVILATVPAVAPIRLRSAGIQIA